jgi:asparagine synthase (glutamine-hydrolysing)
MGHVRLPIQGPDKKHDQPLVQKPWYLAFAGEIFNYKSFNPKLECDTDLILKHLLSNDKAGVQSWDGFWSILLYNSNTHLLHIYLDHLAKKPLYYNTLTGDVSSEMKALCIGQTPEPNELYYSQVAKWGYVHSSQHTWDKNIIKLVPGSSCVIDTQTNSFIQFDLVWGLKPNPKVDPVRALELSVKNRTISDVPFSLLLSGGLDSSMIYKILEKITHNFTIYHIDNNESEFLDDLKIPSDIIVKKLSVSSDKIVGPIELVERDLDRILYYNESPVDLGSMLPQYKLAEAIYKTDTHVTITGDGADELYGGYTRSEQYDSQASDIYDELVYYHLPRLDKLMMSKTIELRSPFLAPYMISHALTLPYSQRTRKNGLKEVARKLKVPESIIQRKKVALKSEPVRENPIEWRLELIRRFREVVNLYYIS